MTKLKEQSMTKNGFRAAEAPEILLPPFSVNVWEKDEDIINLRSHINDKTKKIWDDGIHAFVNGDWASAITHFNEVLELTGGKDGPSRNIMTKMAEYEFKAPPDWKGYRIL